MILESQTFPSRSVTGIVKLIWAPALSLLYGRRFHPSLLRGARVQATRSRYPRSHPPDVW